jgi:Trypsin-like peptidase domain
VQASRPGGARAGHGLLQGASRRLAWLPLALGFLLCGHARHGNLPDYSGVDQAVVEIVLERQGSTVARGSGVVLASREEGAGEHVCYLVTVGHVLTPAGGGADIVVVVPDEDGQHRAPGELLYQVDAEDRDLAIVRAVAPTCRPVRVGQWLEPGADVWLAGFGSRGAAHVWPGHLRETPAPGAARWTVDGLVTEGASGGGVFDARSGELVGLIQGYWIARLLGPRGWIGGEGVAGTSAVIPMARVRAILREWGLDGLLDDAASGGGR